jgi:hypothetical protein
MSFKFQEIQTGEIRVLQEEETCEQFAVGQTEKTQ